MKHTRELHDLQLPGFLDICHRYLLGLQMMYMANYAILLNTYLSYSKLGDLLQIRPEAVCQFKF